MPVILIEKGGKSFSIPYTWDRRIKFEKKHGHRSLEKLFGMLVSYQYTFTEIGREFALSRETIRIIYTEEVAPYLDKELSGRERRAMITVLNLPTNYPDYVKHVKERAQQEGIAVSLVYGQSDKRTTTRTPGYYVLRKDLLLNGRRCHVQVTRVSAAKYSYAKLGVQPAHLNGIYLIVVRVENGGEKIFILPPSFFTEIYSHAYQRESRSNRITLHIDRLGSKIDWDSYENAWHFFNEPPL